MDHFCLRVRVASMDCEKFPAAAHVSFVWWFDLIIMFNDRFNEALNLNDAIVWNKYAVFGQQFIKACLDGAFNRLI